MYDDRHTEPRMQQCSLLESCQALPSSDDHSETHSRRQLVTSFGIRGSSPKLSLKTSPNKYQKKARSTSSKKTCPTISKEMLHKDQTKPAPQITNQSWHQNYKRKLAQQLQRKTCLQDYKRKLATKVTKENQPPQLSKKTCPTNKANSVQGCRLMYSSADDTSAHGGDDTSLPDTPHPSNLTEFNAPKHAHQSYPIWRSIRSLRL